MKYTLSNRQRKELDRGAELQIALPIDPMWCGDGAWIQLRLPEVRRVRPWTTTSVWVNPLNRKHVGLSDLLGEIVDADNIRHDFRILVQVVVITFCDVPNPKTRYPTRWPGGSNEIQ